MALKSPKINYVYNISEGFVVTVPSVTPDKSFYIGGKQLKQLRRNKMKRTRYNWDKVEEEDLEIVKSINWTNRRENEQMNKGYYPSVLVPVDPCQEVKMPRVWTAENEKKNNFLLRKHVKAEFHYKIHISIRKCYKTIIPVK